MDEQLHDYRSWLIAAEQKAQEDFDKTVLSLSGGALGISFAFVKDFVKSDPLINPGFLLASWVTWGISATCVLASYYFSQQALRCAVRQVDEGTIYRDAPGRFFSRLTRSLNASGAVLFFIGIVFLVVFVARNMR